MEVSVIIPAHNEEKYLGDCLQSLLDHRTEDILEIIVVDNASTDGTSTVAKRFPGVRVVSEPKKGLTSARQRGLLEARGTHLAYLDADTRASKQWFEVLRKQFSQFPNLVALSGPYDYYDLPPLRRFAAQCYWRLLVPPAYALAGYMVIGGNFVARKDALLAIGGFDRTIAFYGEDTDIARRLSAVGKVKYFRPFFVLTSGRRILGEGMLRIGWVYTLNFLSIALRAKPLTKAYRDIR
jgi:glycosyltransferase involved in cell wall biosynthesis